MFLKLLNILINTIVNYETILVGTINIINNILLRLNLKLKHKTIHSIKYI